MASIGVGSTIGRYRLEKQIGKGGMGVVYRATHTALERPVALKVITEEISEDEGFRERFRREPKMAASIDHPNVVPVFDAGEDQGQLFVAMRLVDGDDLRTIIVNEGPLASERASAIVVQLADALDAAHALELIHRDVKPGNVLVEQRNGQEHVYLTDFGLTKGRESSAAVTKTGEWVGTPDYVAPEQIEGSRLDHRTDIYALGAVLYHMLAGRPPYANETEVAKIYAHLSKPPPEVPASVEAHEAMTAAIRRAMAKDPGDRYASAGDLGREATIAAKGILDELSPETVALAASPGPQDDAEHHAPERKVAPTTVTGTTEPSPEASESSQGRQAPRPDTRVDRPLSTKKRSVGRNTRKRRALIGAGLLCAALSIAGGFALGSSGDDGAAEPSSFSASASAGTLEVSFPSGWERTEAPLAVPGISFNDQISLRPNGDAEDAGIAAGQVDAAGPTLLSDETIASLGDSAPTGVPVQVGDHDGLLYSDLAPEGYDGTLTIFALPTTAGVATVACASPTGASEAVSRNCDGIASTLRLVGANAFPIGPDPGYAERLSAAIATLNRQRQAKLKKARDSETQEGQSTALAELSDAYANAADTLENADLSPAVGPGNRAIIAALDSGRDAYSAMSAAAESDDSEGYDAAREDAGSADNELAAALQALAPLGYEVN